MARRRSPSGLAAATALAAGLVVVAIVAWTSFRPWLELDRVVPSSTPVPFALFQLSTVTVRHDEQACISDATMDVDAQVAYFNATSNGHPGPPLDIAINGTGYRFRGHVATWTDRGGIALRVSPPRNSVRVRFCITNRGRTPVGLYGTAEGRSLARPSTTINGKPLPTDISMRFDEASFKPLTKHMGSTFRHAANFTPFGSWLPWLLAILLILGVPLGTLGALAVAVRSDASGPRAAARGCSAGRRKRRSARRR